MAQSRGMTTLFFDLADYFDPMMKTLDADPWGRMRRAQAVGPFHTVINELVLHLDEEMGR